MKLCLQSTNHDKSHEFSLLVRDKELIFVTPDGDEICSISVQTMEADKKNDVTGKYEPVATNNFWLVFDAPGCQLDKNLAEAIVEDIAQP